MTRPQPGIFALGTRYHHHLEIDLRDGVEPDAVLAAMAALREPHVTAGASNLVVGLSGDWWARLAPGSTPEGLRSFEALDGCGGHHAPATQHDLWIWTHGSGTDEVLDCALGVASVFADIADAIHETSCFVYHDSRDLTGFVDGSANPSPTEAPDVACVPAGAPGAGGCHVIAQRWVHDLDAFGALEVADQERVIGRTRLDSVALPADVRPADSHITRAEVHDAEGNERQIYRRSTPFGNVTERGLLFLAFSAERDRFDQMLSSMFGTGGATIHDHLLDFTQAVSGSYYFAPSADDLAALGVMDS